MKLLIALILAATVTGCSHKVLVKKCSAVSDSVDYECSTLGILE